MNNFGVRGNGSGYTRWLGQAARFNKVRRGGSLTGVETVKSLTRPKRLDAYARTSARSRVTQIARQADDLDEPADDRTVDMLAALGPCESAYSADEANLVDWAGKSRAQFEELQAHFGFVGGAHQEYARYFNRTKLAKNPWEFIQGPRPG